MAFQLILQYEIVDKIIRSEANTGEGSPDITNFGEKIKSER
jgi:hypothetical protein